MMQQEKPMTFAQKLRTMDPAIQALHSYALEFGLVRSCWSCDNMNRDTNVCQKFKVQPPVRVITFSCGPDWEERVPF